MNKGTWVFIFLSIIFVIIFLIAAWYVVKASEYIRDISGYENDKYLSSAADYAGWAAGIDWAIVSLVLLAFVIGIIIFAYGGAEVAEAGEVEEVETGSTSSYFSYIVFFVLIILIIITGIFSAIAASDISKSPIYASGGNTNAINAYHNAVISAIISIVSVILFFISLGIYYYVTRPVKKEEREKEKEERGKEKEKKEM